jgi:ADP-heptose:LPS heptosyltransferase
MHVAHSTNVPSVTLFSDKEPFRYWTTKACATRAIQSMGSANEIPAAAVAKEVAMALKRITAPNH